MTSRGAMWCSPQRDAIAGSRNRYALQPHHNRGLLPCIPT
jgi:hypothetical protein